MTDQLKTLAQGAGQCDLLPCPFCNEVPTLRSDAAAVTCRNDRCTVRPAVGRITIEEAVRAWNQRPALSKEHADLEQRLRDLAKHWRGRDYPTDASVYELAASFIEQLRARSPAPATTGERLCQKCGQPTKHEEALVDGQIWCHPCADAKDAPATTGRVPPAIVKALEVAEKIIGREFPNGQAVTDIRAAIALSRAPATTGEGAPVAWRWRSIPARDDFQMPGWSLSEHDPAGFHRFDIEYEPLYAEPRSPAESKRSGVEALADWFYDNGHEFLQSDEEDVARALIDTFDVRLK